VSWERELKKGLAGEQEYDRVLAAVEAVRKPRTVLQDNHFFDTEDFALREASYACRLRVTHGGALLTLKGPSSHRGDLSDRPESECKVQPDAARAMLLGILRPREFLDAQDLSPKERELVEDIAQAAAGRELIHHGHFANLRTTIVTKLAVGEQTIRATLEIDHSLFPDGSSSHEIELEIPDGEDPELYEAALDALLASAEVTPVHHPGKGKRLFNALKQQQEASGR
jgi:uncharacterized protein YjbK